MKKHTRHYLRLARKYGPTVIVILRIAKIVADILSSEATNYKWLSIIQIGSKLNRGSSFLSLRTNVWRMAAT